MRAPFPVIYDGDSNGLGIENSSIRFKENVLNLTFNVDDFFNKIRPVSYTYKGTIGSQYHGAAGRPDIGFIAEEVELFEPLLVAYMPQEEGPDLPHSVYYDRFVPYLVEITKGLRAEIKTLQEEVNLLKNN